MRSKRCRTLTRPHISGRHVPGRAGRDPMAFPHKSQKIAETIARWFEEQRYRPGRPLPLRPGAGPRVRRQPRHGADRPAPLRRPGVARAQGGRRHRGPRSQGAIGGGGARGQPRRWPSPSPTPPTPSSASCCGRWRAPCTAPAGRSCWGTPGSWPSARSRWSTPGWRRGSGAWCSPRPSPRDAFTTGCSPRACAWCSSTGGSSRSTCPASSAATRWAWPRW